jgi:hypothetical protein
MFFACDSITIPDDEIDPTTIINSGGNSVPDSIKGSLLFHENFQKWKRTGYFLQTKQDCETDLMTSTGIVSYLPSILSVIYDSLTVNYSIIDFAINPECGNVEGTSTDGSEVSNGYVALQCPIWYTCNHYSKGDLTTSPIPSVSYIEFTVSYPTSTGNTYPSGVSLWKKGDEDADTVKVGTYIPANTLKGEKFTVKINSKNVIIIIKSEKNISMPIANESNINRAVRIHDLKIWTKNK